MSQEALIHHLENEITNEVYELSEAEIKMLLKRSEKYPTLEYLYHQQAAYTKEIKGRIEGGIFKMRLLLQEGKISDHIIILFSLALTKNEGLIVHALLVCPRYQL